KYMIYLPRKSNGALNCRRLMTLHAVDPGAGVSRREFYRRLLATGAGAMLLPLLDWAARAESTAPAAPAMRLGYAAITWGGNDELAIDEIAALGFHGIQLRSGVLEKWGQRPAELKRRLDDKGLALLCFSSGTVDATPEREQEHLATHTRNAGFVAAL